MNGNKELNGQTEMYDEYGNDISIGGDSSIIQYQECNLENVSVMLNELLEKNVNEESGLVGLCSDDITKLDIIRNGVKERFGVSITSEDIVNSSNVKEFADRIILIADSPDYSVRKRDLRREQLLSIAENGNLDAITKNLVKANKKLEESRDVIKNIKAPIDKIGHQYESEFWRGIFDAVDPKVGRTELKKVVLAIDGNTYHSVKALGDAIENTNTWIDEICKMLIWIIQIEDDIYGLTEEASRETLRISKLLSQEGVNIEGLTKIAALEQSKRQSFQLKIKEFKSDIHGKIEFLNEVHKNLLVQFKDHKSAIDKKIESANIALEQKAGAYFNDLNEKITDSLKEYESAQQNIMDLLSEENHKRVDEFESMKNAQRQFLETTNSNFEQRNAKIEETASSFIKDQTELANQTQKRVKLYQAVSIIACVVSVASLIVAIFV